MGVCVDVDRTSSRSWSRSRSRVVLEKRSHRDQNDFQFNAFTCGHLSAFSCFCYCGSGILQWKSENENRRKTKNARHTAVQTARQMGWPKDGQLMYN